MGMRVRRGRCLGIRSPHETMTTGEGAEGRTMVEEAEGRTMVEEAEGRKMVEEAEGRGAIRMMIAVVERRRGVPMMMRSSLEGKIEIGTGIVIVIETGIETAMIRPLAIARKIRLASSTAPTLCHQS
jgi:hypothetical protein